MLPGSLCILETITTRQLVQTLDHVHTFKADRQAAFLVPVE